LSTAKKTAPFYSAVDEALAAVKRPKGTGAEFYTELTKQPGVKKAELADRKLEQAFKAKGKITKEEAQQVLADNPPPQLSEHVYDITNKQYHELLNQKRIENGYKSWSEVPNEKRWEWEAELDPRFEKHGAYKTHNGKNYREILLKLPVEGEDAKKLNELSMTIHGVPYTDLMGDTSEMAKKRLAVKREYKNIYGESGLGAEDRSMYRSGHWKEHPNVLAHARVQDIDGPNGEKILQIEEIQSDWHQAGRKKGYKPDNYIEQSNDLDNQFSELGKKRADLLQEAERIGYRGEGFHKLIDEANSITPRLMQLQEQRDKFRNVISYGVPEAPFKKNWHELTMKRLLNYAADNGYDSIAITPGPEQAKRYDLSKQVDDLQVYRSPDGTFDIKATLMRDASTQNVGNRIAPEQLSDYVGQTLAEKLLAQRNNTQKFYNGEDLSIGGEGMKGFYDKMLPDYLNTFGKPYGAQVQLNSYQLDIPSEARSVNLHTFPITPQMRESIKQKGLPLYQQVGIPTVGTGAASQMFEPQEEPEYAPGGAIAKMAKKAIPVTRAPEIIRPSGLTELKKIVQQEKGGYGARRLERAADEIPNLEKMYQQEALRQAFVGDNAKALMTMNPADFEKYATPLVERARHWGNLGAGDPDKANLPTADYIKYLRTVGPFDEVPFLEINKQEQGLPLIPFISGHEGRHRNRALASQGEQAGLVQLLPRAELREPLPRRSQEEYIDALKQELEMTGNLVDPQEYWSTDVFAKKPRIRLPTTKLPDIYAKGGEVKHQVKKAVGGAINFDTVPDMSDQGRMIQGAPFKRGGKVNLTTNRDTMFLELSNKKLKRK
jgi:hypothetical protein